MGTIAISSARETALGDQINNPFFAWENQAVGATLSGTATLTDGAAANAINGTTYDYWLPDVTTTTATFAIELGAAATLSFGAIAAHNLADLGATARIQRSTDGSSWSDAGAGAVTPTDNGPIAWRMVTTGQDAAYWRLYVSGLTSGDNLYVGVILLGDDIVIPRRIYQGFTPVLSPTEVQLQSSVSVGGNLLGSSVITRGSTLQASFGNVAPSFIRGAAFSGFQAAFNDGKGAFFGWRPDKYASDLHYVWRNGNVIRPTNTGPLDLMGFDVSMSAYDG